MDASLKELTKLETLTAAKGKSPSIIDSLDSLLDSLNEAKEQFLMGKCTEEQLNHLTHIIESKKREIEERHKEIYTSLSRFGRSLDKASRMLSLDLILTLLLQKFPTSLPSYPDLFSSASSVTALERTIALHLLRTGQFEVAETFLQVGSWSRSVYSAVLNAYRNQRSKYLMIYVTSLWIFTKSLNLCGTRISVLPSGEISGVFRPFSIDFRAVVDGQELISHSYNHGHLDRKSVV